MKHKILIALLFLTAGASLAFAKEPVQVKTSGTKLEPKVISKPPQPKRPNDDTYWDFGKVKEGAVIKHRFFIENPTKNIMKIKQIVTSCNCTASRVEQDTVPPGRKIPIYVEFNTKGYPGERTRYTYVHTDSPKIGILVFEINAEVV